MTPGDRLRILIEAEGLQLKEFYRRVGLPSRYLDSIRGGVKRVTIQKVLKPFPYWNAKWILEGEGDMYTDDREKKIAPRVSFPLYINYIKKVPLVNQYAHTEYIGSYTDKKYMKKLPTIPFIVSNEAFGNYIAFEVKGNGMNDGTEESYLEGDKLICREIEPLLWNSIISNLRKWDFVIIHTEGLFIKRITEYNIVNQTITVQSLNDTYSNRVLNLCDVKQLFRIVELQRPKKR